MTKYLVLGCNSRGHAIEREDCIAGLIRARLHERGCPYDVGITLLFSFGGNKTKESSLLHGAPSLM